MKEAFVYHSLSPSITEVLSSLGYDQPTEPQTRAIPSILEGKNVLLIAPSGSGKTEAALLPVFEGLLGVSEERGIKVLYITPLRALNRDMLRRVKLWSHKLGFSVDVRHGDTSRAQRRKQSVDPPDMLITTPETLQAILPGKLMRRNLGHVRWVIVDEIHEVAESKRGAQLTIGLERLREATQRDFQRIGLSATVGSPDQASRLLFGEGGGEVIQCTVDKKFEYSLELPSPTERDYEMARSLYTSPHATARLHTIREIVENNTATLVFVNSRTNAEMLGSRLLEMDQKIAVHHGSLSREERERVEDLFKKGKLRGLICTSTLELGIDIGRVDGIVQYLSPRQVTSLIQRVGRSGHTLTRVSEGIVVTSHSDDALESLAIVRRAERGDLEPLETHDEALDVLAHQMVGLALDLEHPSSEKIYSIARRSQLYANVSYERFSEVLDYLVRLGLLFVRDGKVGRTKRTRFYYYENLSMIPDERRYPILDVAGNKRVGTLGDEFIQTKARIGLNFICSGRVWRIQAMTQGGDVLVTPVEDPTAAIPGWDGEILPVPFEVAQEVGGLRREIVARLREGKREELIEEYSKALLTEREVAERLIRDFEFFVRKRIPAPTDRRILVEGWRNYVILHACLGESANRTLGFILEGLLSREGLVNWFADGYRLLLEMSPGVEGTPQTISKLLSELTPERWERLFRERVESSFPFTYQMKHVAERFGAIPRGLFGSVKLDTITERFKETPVYREALREGLLERMNLSALKKLALGIQSGLIEVAVHVGKDAPSPLGYYILNQFLAFPEMIAPETVLEDSIAHMRGAINTRPIRLSCMACDEWEASSLISELDGAPACPKCGSRLLAVLNKLPPETAEQISRKRRGESLEDRELKWVSLARRTADLMLSYGKRAGIALSVTGVGPQTASRILSKMHGKEEELYQDLLQAKLHYLMTRDFWK
ncbi:MAG: DEAD/DEAH box helicase [Candidatus Geothermarchaeales archaeon]